MEFETSSKEKTDDISDEMRLAASSRKTVITPIHEDIYADEESDELIATQHTLAPPIANIPSDTEATTAYTDANTQAGQKTQKTHKLALIIGTCAGVVLIALATVFILTRYF